MKSTTRLLTRLLASGAAVAFVAGFGSLANASGDPDSIARKYPSAEDAYTAPATPSFNLAPNFSLPVLNFGIDRAPNGDAPVNLGQGSGIGHTIRR